MLAAAADAALELLSPTRCAVCERPGTLLCDACRAHMVRIDPLHACLRCGAPFGDMLCTECRELDVSLDRCLAAAVFDGPPARLVRVYKDGGEQRLAFVIAELLHCAAIEAQRRAPARYGGLLAAADAVTFVPATASAFRRRGFDHMEAVARALARESGLPLLDALVKRGRFDQRALDRAGRLAGPSSVYEAVEGVRGMRLLLLDDVITTGATLNAAARILVRAGAAHVDGLALARVWG